MFPGRCREGNSCDFGTLRTATQQYARVRAVARSRGRCADSTPRTNQHNDLTSGQRKARQAGLLQFL